MALKPSKKFIPIAFLLNGLLFLQGGIGLVSDHKTGFGLLQLLAAFLNLSMLVPFKSHPVKGNLELGILVMNILVAISIAIDYLLIGKSYIQYAWMLVAIMSCITLVIKLRKRNTLPEINN